MSPTLNDPRVLPARLGTGILLVAHAPLAGAFVRVASDMGLDGSQMACLDMTPDMSREQALATGKMLIGDMHCKACLVLVDLGGGCSPFAVADMLRNGWGESIRVVTGLNVPMLVTALGYQNCDVDELARRAEQRGRDGIRSQA